MIFKKNGSSIENDNKESDIKLSERYSPEVKKKIFSSSHNVFSKTNFHKQETISPNNLINTDVTSLSKLKNMNKASPVKLHAIGSEIKNSNSQEKNSENENNNNNFRNSDFTLYDCGVNINKGKNDNDNNDDNNCKFANDNDKNEYKGNGSNNWNGNNNVEEKEKYNPFSK